MNEVQTIQKKISDTSGEIVMYQPDETIRLEVRLGEDTVWLSQQQMAELFMSSRTNIVEHIQHIYSEEELEENSTCRNFRQVRQEGSTCSILELVRKEGDLDETSTVKEYLTVHLTPAMLTEHLSGKGQKLPPPEI